MQEFRSVTAQQHKDLNKKCFLTFGLLEPLMTNRKSHKDEKKIIYQIFI